LDTIDPCASDSVRRRLLHAVDDDDVYRASAGWSLRPVGR